jgi:hypothetical protein
MAGQLRDAAIFGRYLIEESAAGRLKVQYGSPYVLGKLRELLGEPATAPAVEPARGLR